jgi:hypothetical protein
MSKLTGRKSKKDIFYPETGLPGKTDPPTKDGYVMGGDYIKKSTGEKITGESTGKIKVDEKGVKYVEDIDNPSDTTQLKNIGPIQQKYSSMKSMGQAISKWTSPHKLIGKASPMEQEGLTPTYYDKKKRKEQKEKYKDIDKKEAKEKGVNYRSDEKIERQAKRDEKKAYMETDEGKAERKKKATEVIQTLGSFLKDIGKPDSKVKKAGTTTPKDDREEPEDKKVKKTAADDLGTAQVIKVPK